MLLPTICMSYELDGNLEKFAHAFAAVLVYRIMMPAIAPPPSRNYIITRRSLTIQIRSTYLGKTHRFPRRLSPARTHNRHT